jgi:hypothetical protein
MRKTTKHASEEHAPTQTRSARLSNKCRTRSNCVNLIGQLQTDQLYRNSGCRSRHRVAYHIGVSQLPRVINTTNTVSVTHRSPFGGYFGQHPSPRFAWNHSTTSTSFVAMFWGHTNWRIQRRRTPGKANLNSRTFAARRLITIFTSGQHRTLKKGKAFPLQASTGTWGSRRLRLQNF